MLLSIIISKFCHITRYITYDQKCRLMAAATALLAVCATAYVLDHFCARVRALENFYVSVCALEDF